MYFPGQAVHSEFDYPLLNEEVHIFINKGFDACGSIWLEAVDGAKRTND